MNKIGSHSIHIAEKRTLKQQSIRVLDNYFVVVLASDNVLYMSVSSVCTSLRIGVCAQVRRIKRTLKLASALCQLVLVTRGGSQLSSCLTLNQIPTWLAGIHTNRSSSLIHQTLEFCQQNLMSQADSVFPSLESFQNFSDAKSQKLEGDQVVEEQALIDQPSLTNITSKEISSYTFVFDCKGHTSSQKTGVFETSETGFIEQVSERIRKGLLSPRQALLANIPSHDLRSYLLVPNCEEDIALRESCVAQEQQWIVSDSPYYTATNQLQVFLDTSEYHLDSNKVYGQISKLGINTVRTARIALGLWYSRWKDRSLSENGYAVVGIKEILEWRAVQKHSQLISPGSSVRVSDGYQTRHLKEVCQDFFLLQQCCLCQQDTMLENGSFQKNNLIKHYMDIEFITEGHISPYNQKVVGFLVRPGDWFDPNSRQVISKFAVIDRQVFALDPQGDFLAIRIAFHLVERWHALVQVSSIDLINSTDDPLRPYKTPIMMCDLLAASMLVIDKNNLTNRFVARVEAALDKLFEKRILGTPAECITPINTVGHWGRAWLTSLWYLLPNLQVADVYEQLIRGKYS